MPTISASRVRAWVARGSVAGGLVIAGVLMVAGAAVLICDNYWQQIVGGAGVGLILIPAGIWATKHRQRNGPAPQDVLQDIDARLRQRPPDTLKQVEQDVYIATTIVRTLDDRLSNLLRRYGNLASLRSPEALKTLNADADALLAGQQLHPRLEQRTYALEEAAKDEYLGKDLREAVASFVKTLHTYLRSLGEPLGSPGLLKEVRRLAGQLEGGAASVDANQIIAMADQMRGKYDAELSKRIRKLEAKVLREVGAQARMAHGRR